MNDISRSLFRAAAWLALATLLYSQPSAGQEPPSLALVTSKGSGTVYVRPSHVVFRLHESITADTMEQSLKSSAKLGESLRAYLTENELRPTSFEISTPSVVSVEGNLVRASAELQFSMAPYAGGEAGAAKLGLLCDQIQAFAKSHGCELSRPDFVTGERASVIQDAVREATKNAYTAAAGAAAALGATIRAVDTVEVGDVVWNAPPDSEVAYPTIEQIACTAGATLTYLLEYP